MKKIMFAAACAMIIASAISCTKEPSAPKMKTISVELGAPQMNDNAPQSAPASKTCLVDGSHVYWTAADKNILCFTTDLVTNGVPYDLTSTENVQSANKTFIGEIPENTEPRFYFYDRNFVASKRNAQIKEEKKYGQTIGYYIRRLLDNDQRAGSGPYNTFHTGMNYSIAKPGDSGFKNTLGYLKWTNKGNAIRSVKMETLDASEFLTGYFDVHYADSEPNTVVSPQDNIAHFNYVTSGMQDNKTIPENTSFYAIVIPGTYHGLQFTINLATGGTFVIKDTREITVNRGEIINFGVLPTCNEDLGL